MAYLSLYRKYRSQTFGDLVGQDHVVRTLQNGIASGRIAHSYLFTGPRGTGKTSTARLLAKALCCEHGPSAEPDNTCAICQEITAGTCVDVQEMDAASDSDVDDIREAIVEVAEYKPMVARYKVFIIDEVHDLSAKAFDALLKTIEEPPEHIVFILATTEFAKVPPTIRSRCQKYEFHRASMSDLVGRLTYVAQQEGVAADPAAITAIARMADGGYRDGLTLLEQAIVTSDGKITLEQVYDQLGMVSEESVDTLLTAIKQAEIPTIMETLAEIARRGRDPRAILESMLYRLADLTRASYQIDVGAGDAAREAALHETAAQVGRETILRLRGELSEAHKVIRDISLPRLWLESELVRLAQSPSLHHQPQPEPVAKPRSQPPAEKKPSAIDLAADLVATAKPSITPKPVEAPAPEAPKADRPAPEPAKEPAGPGTNPPTDVAGVWAALLEQIRTRYSGKRVELALVGAQVELVEGSVLQLSLLRNMDVEYFNGDPRRIGMIATLVNQCGGHGWTVRFVAAKREPKLDEPVSVELPAEGQRLEQIVKEVFLTEPPLDGEPE